MKTHFYNSVKAKATMVAVFLLLMFGLFSCEYYGRDGLPGRSYLALEWKQNEPGYIEAGNKYIPSLFYWGEYYRIPAGIYILYYEGEYFNGRRWINYAWEIEYEIWENPGEYGLPNGIDGRNGADAYFTIECSPAGPIVFVDEFFKTATLEEMHGFELIVNTNEMIEIKQTRGDFTLRVKYRKVEPKNQTSR